MRQLAIVAVGAMLMATSTPPIRSEDAATAQTTMRIVQGQRDGTGDGRSMLSRAAAVAESADGALYVLDPGLNKVVVFNRDGTLRRLVAIGMGRGPGELEAPRSIALSDEGELIVLDGRAGEPLSSTPSDNSSELSRLECRRSSAFPLLATDSTPRAWSCGRRTRRCSSTTCKGPE